MTSEDRTGRIRRGPVPVSKQIAADIAADIAAKRLRKNDKLPGELSLMDSYGVSRVTIRRAISRLREEKLLIATQGVGTFVHGTPEAAKAVLNKLYDGSSMP